MKYKIVLWGIGSIYNYIRNTVCYLEMTKQAEVVGLTSKVIPQAETLDGYRLLKPEELKDVEYDYIFVLSDGFYKDIVDDAVLKYGIPRYKLIRYKVLMIPQIMLKDYFALYESRLTILSNNCWGGTVYNTLGMECRSPLKNLFLTDEAYLKLLSDIEGYFMQSPYFLRYEKDIHSDKKYPVLCLKDIEIHCNHAKNPQQAIEDWERRVKKVNYNNLFCEMYTESEASAKAFEELKQYDKRICFVPWETNLTNQMQLQLGEGQTEFWETVNSNAAIGSNAFQYNLIDLLLGKKTYRLL